jgi:ABC-2 type transport system ATP-binding protein
VRTKTSEDPSSALAIEAVGLRKSFGPAKSPVRALDGLDLAVRAGEVHAFLGPNGAGKTTTIRILLGLLRKDRGPGGTVTLLGGDPWRDATGLHSRLAYVPGDVTLWPNLTGGEIIDLLGRLRGGPRGVRVAGVRPPGKHSIDLPGRLRGDGHDTKRRDELIERFQLDPARKARTYSKGNRQKVALIAALASDAELLLLDEPTAGLDPLMEEAFRECVTRERESGRTVLLSSHILSEAEALADRVTIIRAGRAVETGTLAELRHLTRTTIDAELERPVDPARLPGIHDPVAGPGAGGGMRLRCEADNASLTAVLRALTDAGVRTLTCRPPTLEELFLRHYATQTGASQTGAPQAGASQAGAGRAGAS